MARPRGWQSHHRGFMISKIADFFGNKKRTGTGPVLPHVMKLIIYKTFALANLIIV